MSAIDPRIARSRAAVMAAAVAELAARGFARASVDRIAAASGVAKTTIYRHWPNRTALLLAAADASLPSAVPAPGEGDAGADLTAALAQVGRRLHAGPFAALVPSLLDEARRDPDAAASWDGLLDRLTRPLRDVLAAHGLPRGATAIDMLVGPVLHRTLARRTAVRRSETEAIVDAFLRAPGWLPSRE